jgi:hypothetical protein
MKCKRQMGETMRCEMRWDRQTMQAKMNDGWSSIWMDGCRRWGSGWMDEEYGMIVCDLFREIMVGLCDVMICECPLQECECEWECGYAAYCGCWARLIPNMRPNESSKVLVWWSLRRDDDSSRMILLGSGCKMLIMYNVIMQQRALLLWDWRAMRDDAEKRWANILGFTNNFSAAKKLSVWSQENEGELKDLEDGSATQVNKWAKEKSDVQYP